MFSYLSMLLEEKFVDEITVGFLIVGHTHASIDQFFSTLSSLISKASFIGSPLALMNLFLENKKDTLELCRQIVVCYDFKRAIAPFVNKKLKVSINNCMLFCYL